MIRTVDYLFVVWKNSLFNKQFTWFNNLKMVFWDHCVDTVAIHICNFGGLECRHIALSNINIATFEWSRAHISLWGGISPSSVFFFKLTHLSLRDVEVIFLVYVFKLVSRIDILSKFLWNWSLVNDTRTHCRLINTDWWCQSTNHYLNRCWNISICHLAWLRRNNLNGHQMSLQWRHNGEMAFQITSLSIVYSTVYSA